MGLLIDRLFQSNKSEDTVSNSISSGLQSTDPYNAVDTAKGGVHLADNTSSIVISSPSLDGTGYSFSGGCGGSGAASTISGYSYSDIHTYPYEATLFSKISRLDKLFNSIDDVKGPFTKEELIFLLDLVERQSDKENNDFVNGIVSKISATILVDSLK